MAAVVGGDHQVVLVRRGLRHPADALPGAVQGLQVLRAHPAVVMPGAVGEAQVEEHEVRFHPGEHFQERIREEGVAVVKDVVVHVVGEAHVPGHGDIPQLLPVGEHGGGLPGAVEDLHQAPYGPDLGHIGVGDGAVALRRHRVEERDVAGQGDAGHDAPPGQLHRAALQEFLAEGVAAEGLGVRPHTVHQDQDTFLSHLSSLVFFIFRVAPGQGPV